MTQSKSDRDQKKKIEKAQSEPQQEKHHVMTFFGVPLEVASKKLAVILKADMKDILAADISHIGQSILDKHQKEETTKKKAENATKVANEINHEPKTSSENFVAFKSRIETIGEILGFEVTAGGVWRSPTKLILLVRYVDQPCSSDRAKKFALNLYDQLQKITGESSGLFVVHDQLTCDVFKVAIKGKHLYSHIRVITYDNLNELLVLKNKKKLNHQQVATLLVPLENIDVGELLNVIRATHLENLII